MKSYKFLKIWDGLRILNQNEHTLLDKSQYVYNASPGRNYLLIAFAGGYWILEKQFMA